MRHVVFVHGLGGERLKTWTTKGRPPAFWPKWLSEDDPTLAIWTIGYDGSRSNWAGGGMALTDRAENILALLLAEPRLNIGEIAFVGHSFGGLVIEETLQVAEREAKSCREAEDFLLRVRKVALLGVPHAGLLLASTGSAFSWLGRPSPATQSVEQEDPHLRAVLHWFRKFVTDNALDVIVLTEGQSQRKFGISIPVFGKVVSPSSADPGLPVTPIPVDADHTSISKPSNRASEVYLHIRKFVTADSAGRPRTSILAESIIEVGARVNAIKEQVAEGQADLAASVAAALGQSENPLVTEEAEDRLLAMRKSRYATDFDHKAECQALADEVLSGDLRAASRDVRRRVLAWCARVIASTDIVAAKSLSLEAAKLGSGEENVIAEAFLFLFSGGTKNAAIARLAAFDSAMAQTARFLIAANQVEPAAALQWLVDAGLTAEDLDPDGKLAVIQRRLMAAEWDLALSDVKSLTEEDFDAAPLLLTSAASASLAQTVHSDLRPMILHLPPDLEDFPLGTDARSMELREKARGYYERAASILSSLQRHKAADLSADYSLWLALMNPATAPTAMIELRSTMADARSRLRRLPLALAFGLELDIQAVEREIDSEMALTGGTSVAASIARFALATFQKKPAETVEYIRRYRDELGNYYTEDFIDGIEVEGLARSGQVSEAAEKLQELRKRGFPKTGLEALGRVLDEAGGADPISVREAQYQSTKSLADLIGLVRILKTRRVHSLLVVYGKILFEETKDLPNTELYANALYEEGRDGDVLALAATYPEMVAQSPALETIVAWSHYREGNLVEARKHLTRLRQVRDAANDRYLATNIAIASGDWSSVGSFVESEWQHQAEREPIDLLRAGVLAQRVGSSARSQELVKAAAAKGGEDPHILTNAYSVATSAGWENDEAVHSWLADAIERSGADGPIQRFDIRELMDMNSGWNERETRAWDALLTASAPMFTGARVVNKSLLDIHLRPFLLNLTETDARKRGVIFCFSGARRFVELPPKRIALDITSILNLAGLGLLRRAVEWSGNVVIAHTTLGWLFEERDKLAFHQPSRLRSALEVKALLDRGLLHRLEGGTPPPEIEQRVGDDIARFLVAAMTVDTSDEQKIVIRSYPLTKPGSLMDEVADTAGYEPYLASCSALISALRAGGHLTAAEETRATSYLSQQEMPWPSAPVVQPGATLYLDGLAVTYLQHVQLLERVASAGFKVFVAASDIQHDDALVRHEATATRAKDLLEEIRGVLQAGLAAETIQLGPLAEKSQEDDDAYSLREHPTMTLFAAVGRVDSFVIDDRAYNQHGNILVGEETRPIATSLELLDAMVRDGVVTATERQEAYTTLRRAGLVLIPHPVGELATLIESASVAEGAVQETAELKAVREAVLRVRMTDTLQLPRESVWLDDLLRELVATLRAQWTEAIPDETARARSDWLFRMMDTRGWSHRIQEGGPSPPNRYRSVVLMLLMYPGAPEKDRERYWAWLEDAVLAKFRDEDIEGYRDVVRRAEGVLMNRSTPPAGENSDE